MKMILNKKLANTIIKQYQHEISLDQPRFCCEIELDSQDRCCDIVLEFLNTWSETPVYGCITNSIGIENVILVDAIDMKRILQNIIITEEPMSIVDLSDKKGGCTVDISVEQELQTLLFITWGEKKKILKEFVNNNTFIYTDFYGN